MAEPPDSAHEPTGEPPDAAHEPTREPPDAAHEPPDAGHRARPDSVVQATPSEAARRPRRGPHLWVPACLSGLLLLAFFPLILRLSAPDYEAATGRSPSPYLGRWLLITAGLFLASGLLYAGRRIRASARQRSQAAGGGAAGVSDPDR